MSKSKHTPGPWTVHTKVKGLNGIGIHSANGGYVYVATVHDGFGNGTPPSEANARLIAAAPEVLSALQSAHRMLTILFEQYNYGDSGLIRECGEAIAKATGGAE